MIGFLIRLMMGRRGPRLSIGWLFTGGSSLDFWLGLALYLVGLWFSVDRFLTTYSIGGFGNIFFYLITIGGIVRMMSSADAVLTASVARRHRPGATGLPGVPNFVAPPSEMPPGLCWQCGGRVRPDRVICLHCGASQPVAAPTPSQMAQAAGFEGTGSSAIPRQVRAVAGPPPSRGMPPGPYRRGPPNRDVPPGPPGEPPPGWAPRPPRR